MTFYGPFMQLVSVMIGAHLVGFILLVIGWTLANLGRRALQLMDLVSGDVD